MKWRIPKKFWVNAICIAIPCLAILLTFGAVAYNAVSELIGEPSLRTVWAIRISGTTQLRKDARDIAQYMNQAALHTRTAGVNDGYDVPKSFRPASVRRFDPINVSFDSEAIWIVMRQDHAFFNAVVVFLQVPDIDKKLKKGQEIPGGGNAINEYKLAEGIHWFSFEAPGKLDTTSDEHELAIPAPMPSKSFQTN